MPLLTCGYIYSKLLLLFLSQDYSEILHGKETLNVKNPGWIEPSQ
uniref:Uncharacterized protein n=1 Tax=Manihot esculenta TaxID=3983 RepID=A0A2C9VJQ9_MANES